MRSATEAVLQPVITDMDKASNKINNLFIRMLFFLVRDKINDHPGQKLTEAVKNNLYRWSIFRKDRPQAYILSR